MEPVVLILVTSDPRQSARPVEAIRIAAGLGAWGRLTVHVVLRAAAAQLLEDRDDLVDGLALQRWLPLLVEHGCRVHVTAPLMLQPEAPASPVPVPVSPSLRRMESAGVPAEALDDAGFAALSAQCRYLMRF